jgi:hypothetical protein
VIVKSLLDDAVKTIRAIPVQLFGDDSPLTDPWEEIKEQVQQEMSIYWPAYLKTIEGILEGTVSSLSVEDRALLAAEIRVPSGDSGRLCQTLLKRLLARAKREKIRYIPFEFEYFRYAIDGMAVYAEVIARTGLFTCEIKAYSAAAPNGERGQVNTDIIENEMSADQFEDARQHNWPEEWKEGRTTAATVL